TSPGARTALLTEKPSARLGSVAAWLHFTGATLPLFGPRSTRGHTAVAPMVLLPNSAVSSLSFSTSASTSSASASHVLASGGYADHSIRLWDLDSGALQNALHDAHGDVVTALARNEDGSVLVSGAQDGTVAIWQSQQQRAASSVASPGVLD